MKTMIKRPFFAFFVLFLCAQISHGLAAGENATMEFTFTSVVRDLAPGEDPPLNGLGKPCKVITRKSGEKYAIGREIVIKSADDLEKILKSQTRDGRLTSAQEKILELYNFAQSQSMKDRLTFARDCGVKKIKVNIWDTTQVNSATTSATDTKRINSDFWPCAYETGLIFTTPEIDLSTSYFKGYQSNCAVSVLAHEVAHTFDKTVREKGGYGPDGSHSFNEKTHPKTAWLEGWAEFHELLDFPETESNRRGGLKDVFWEVVPPPDPAIASLTKTVKTDSFSDGFSYFDIEGKVALMLFELSKKWGRDAIFSLFKRVNGRNTCFEKFVKEAAKNPERVKDLFEVLDKETFGKLTDKEYEALLGASDTLTACLEERKAGREKALKEYIENSLPSKSPKNMKQGGDGFSD